MTKLQPHDAKQNAIGKVAKETISGPRSSSAASRSPTPLHFLVAIKLRDATGSHHCRRRALPARCHACHPNTPEHQYGRQQQQPETALRDQAIISAALAINAAAVWVTAAGKQLLRHNHATPVVTNGALHSRPASTASRTQSAANSTSSTRSPTTPRRAASQTRICRRYH